MPELSKIKDRDTGVEYDVKDAQARKEIEALKENENGNNSGGNVDYVGVEPAADDIPKIFFYGTAPMTKSEGDLPLTMEYYSKTKTIKNYVTLKVQGDSSASFPKKNFTVKMYSDEARETKDKHDFKGWGKQSKFVLKANWIDITHSRNVVSAKLWAQVVKSRPDYEELPELLRTSPNQGAIDGFFVKVYLNGVYQGRYTMNIPKDKWMANMDDDLDTHCVLCSEAYNDRTAFKAEPVCNGSDWTDEIHDTMPTNLVQSWKNAANFIRTSTDEDFRANIGAYFNLNSLIDAYCYMVGCLLWDSDGKNQIFFTYDGVQWIQSMYDMDGAWGLHWQGGMLDVETYEVFDYGNILYLRMGELFYDEIQTRWTELRGSVMSSGNIINEFEQFMEICSPELVAEDYASTTADGKFTNIPSKTINNLQLLRANIVKRLAKADELIAALIPKVEVPCTGISLSANTLTFTAEGTQSITATVIPDGCTDSVVWVSTNPSVASIAVNGNTCTIQAIANGESTITVTCGEYSASCSVSVSGIMTDEELEIPGEYAELSYIESTGTQWIDTGISGGATSAWEAKINTLGTRFVTYEQYMGGDKTSGNCKIYLHETEVRFGGLTSGTLTAFPNADAEHVVRVDADGTITVDGEVKTGKGKVAGFGTLTWWLFNSQGESAQPSTMRLHHFKMWKDGILVRNFVPCRRIVDNVAGLYDRVTETFFENIAFGEFICGPDVAPVPCTGISLDKSTLTFDADGSHTLTATVTPEGCTDGIQWSSDNELVAQVNAGVVTTRTNGSATITATCGEYSASCVVTVSGSSIGIAHPFVDGEFNDILAVSAGNHVYALNPLDGGTGNVFAIISDLSKSEPLGHNAKSGISSNIFTINQGDTVRTVVHTNRSNLCTKQISVCVFDNTGKKDSLEDFISITPAVGANIYENTITASKTVNVGGVCLWTNSVANLHGLDFTIEIYVNGVRFV